MFKLEPNPTFWATAEIHVPGEGKGKLEVEFRYLDQAERAEYVKTMRTQTNAEALADIVVNWREIDAPYSTINLERLLNRYDGAAAALFTAFFKELSGAAEKNS